MVTVSIEPERFIFSAVTFKAYPYVIGLDKEKVSLTFSAFAA